MVLTDTIDTSSTGDDGHYIRAGGANDKTCVISFGTLSYADLTLNFLWESGSFTSGSVELLAGGAVVGSASMPGSTSPAKWTSIKYSASGSGEVQARFKASHHPYGNSYYITVRTSYVGDAAPPPPTPTPEPTATPTPEPTPTPAPPPPPPPPDPCLDPTNTGDIGSIPGGGGAYLASPLDPGDHTVVSWPGKTMWYGTHMGFDHAPTDKVNDLEVSAAFDGVVRRTNQGYGAVLISTNGQVKDLYNHIIRFYHENGTRVKAGQPLGVLTTYARPDEKWRGIHVHWERASSDGRGGWIHHQQTDVYTVAWLTKKLGAATVTGDSYLNLYQMAGSKYSFPWQVLAAIGRVESNHGENMGPSSAGALGPMQFMPATWDSYGLDGDGNGTKDIMDPKDAIPAAANYLVLAGGEPKLRDAIYAYNHSNEYVDLVLEWAAKYGYGGGTADTGDIPTTSCPGASEDDDGWNPMGWLWDKIDGVLIPDADDWQEVGAALQPVLDKEPIGTLRDTAGFLKAFRGVLTVPTAATAPDVAGGGGSGGAFAGVMFLFSVPQMFAEMVTLNDMVADTVDAFTIGGIKGTAFARGISSLVAGFSVILYLKSRVVFAA